MIEWFAAAALGAAGSAHCAVMCGPLSLAARGALRQAGRGPDRALTHLALYHGGRLSAYGGAGLVVGAVGQGLATLGTGRGVAIVAGSVLLVQAAARLGLRRAGPAIPFVKVFALLGKASRCLIARRPSSAAFCGGVLNAALPCGLVYAALTAAAAQGRPAAGLAFMVCFGLGTLPLLAAVWLMGSLLAPVGRRLAFATPVALALVGGLLIARGVLAEHSGSHAPGTGTHTHAHPPPPLP
jgi:sulfite exporter TauE/SafE